MHVLSREPQEVELFTGRLDADKLRALLPVTWSTWPRSTTGGCAARSAWSTDAIGAARRARACRGERVHRELFYVDDAPPAAGCATPRRRRARAPR